MLSSKTPSLTSYAIPRAPIIYINDPSKDASVVFKLVELIPKTLHIDLTQQLMSPPEAFASVCKGNSRETVLIIADHQAAEKTKTKQATARRIGELAIRLGCNFASIDLCEEGNRSVDGGWGPNHISLPLEVKADVVSDVQAQEYAKNIYKSLFDVLTVKDTLHLIPDEQMRAIDTSTTFKDYKYCPIGDCTKAKHDAKIQFVALVVSKPVVVSPNRLTWQVADKTGVANFFFKYRGPSSQYTWDWVLCLEPGQRKCLPRMPCVLIQEAVSTSIIKAPLRVPGSIIKATGTGIQFIGIGISSLGKRMKMGRRKRWVKENEVTEYLQQNRTFKIVPGKEKKEVVQVFTEKGTKAWNDNDSSRSTLWDEKTGRVEEKEIV